MNISRASVCRAGMVLCLALGFVVLSAGEITAEEPGAPDLEPLVAQVRKLVLKYYPKAKVELKEDKIRIAFNTRKFMVHHPLLDGSFQDASEMDGPQKGGILGELEIRSGMYGGQASVPQTFNYHYFKLELLAPYSRKLDCHLYVHLYYPRDASLEFVREFSELVNGFDKVLVPSKK